MLIYLNMLQKVKKKKRIYFIATDTVPFFYYFFFRWKGCTLSCSFRWNLVALIVFFSSLFLSIYASTQSPSLKKPVFAAPFRVKGEDAEKGKDISNYPEQMVFISLDEAKHKVISEQPLLPLFHEPTHQHIPHSQIYWEENIGLLLATV